MTGAEKYLRSLVDQNEYITNMIRRKEELIERSKTIKTVDTSVERVQTSHNTDRICDITTEIAALEQEIEEEDAKLWKSMYEFKQLINNVHDMCRLYEKFILEYYKKHYPKLTVSASHIPWALDDGIGDMLPVMQSDIHFQKENTVLIIDAKYYTNTTQVQFDKHTLHSNNLYQIFTYVKNREYQFGDEENKVSGMLLYARTDALIQPDNVYQMHGNQISVKTLDLNKPFDEIAKQLDEIAAAHFDGIEKTI